MVFFYCAACTYFSYLCMSVVFQYYLPLYSCNLINPANRYLRLKMDKPISTRVSKYKPITGKSTPGDKRSVLKPEIPF